MVSLKPTTGHGFQKGEPPQCLHFIDHNELKAQMAPSMENNTLVTESVHSLTGSMA